MSATLKTAKAIRKASGIRAPKLRLKTGDLVAVISGKDKGKQGKILRVYADLERVLVEGINVVKRHTKPSAVQPQGGVIPETRPLHVSKVMIIDPKSGKPSRVRMVRTKDGFQRVAVKSGAVLPEPGFIKRPRAGAAAAPAAQ